MKITKKIYFKFVLLVLSLFVFIATILIFVYNTNTKEMSKKNLELINEQMYYSLNYFSDDMNRIKEKIISYNYDSDIKGIMYSYEYLTRNELAAHFNSLANKIDSMYIISRFIDKVDFYIPITGRVINKTKINILANDLDYEYFKDLKEKYKDASNRLYIDNENSIRFVGTNSSFIGQGSLYEYIVDVELDNGVLYDLFSTFMVYENSYVYLIDDYENILFKSKEGIEIDYDILSSAKSSINIDDKEYIVIREDNKDPNLSLIMIVDEAVFSKYSNNIPLIYIGLVIFLLIIIILSVIYFNSLVEKPIESIVEATGSIEKGEFDIKIEYEKDNEFRLLCDRFNKMSERLQNLVNEVYQKDILINQANFKQLQSQINPHFLYNSFFILSRMIKSNDNKNGSIFVEHLAGYFEYITKVNKENCLLDDEMRHMNDYIEIQKIRYGNKLKIYQNDELDRKNIMVPRLILQPVIENYFKYSRANDADEIVFCINYWNDNDIINIEFTDNVACINKEVIDKLKKELEEEGYNVQTTGLININKRLKITFGDKSGLSIDNIEGGGVRTTIKIDTNIKGDKDDI